MILYFNRSGPEEVDERRIYSGSENPIVMFQKYTHKFHCSFELNYYPFDKQVYETHKYVPALFVLMNLYTFSGLLHIHESGAP